MRKFITRAITSTTIQSANIAFKEGAPELTVNEPITVSGVISEEKALKVARKTYGETAQVTSVTSIDDVYEISVEDFIKHAKKVELPAAPTPEPAAE